MAQAFNGRLYGGMAGKVRSGTELVYRSWVFDAPLPRHQPNPIQRCTCGKRILYSH